MNDAKSRLIFALNVNIWLKSRISLATTGVTARLLNGVYTSIVQAHNGSVHAFTIITNGHCKIPNVFIIGSDIEYKWWLLCFLIIKFAILVTQ